MSIIKLRDGDIIKVAGARYGRQRVGTVSGCAARWNHPDARADIERELERGNKLVWLNAEPVVIAANPASVDRSFVAEVAPGDVVEIESAHDEERGLYRVDRPGPLGGDSCKLVRVMTYEERDALITQALGIAPGESIRIDIEDI